MFDSKGGFFDYTEEKNLHHVRGAYMRIYAQTTDVG